MTETRKVRIGEGDRITEVEVQVPEGEPAIWDAGVKLDVVGTAVPRLDGAVRTTGRAKYTHDVTLPGMLFARVLRSPHPHARLAGIDATEASRLPGVKAVVTFERPDAFSAIAETDEAGNPIGGKEAGGAAAEARRVLYAGDDVAAVAAVSADVAQDALRLIKVNYDVLPHVTDLEVARRDDAPKIFPEGNLRPPSQRKRGDIDAGFKDADVIVEGTWRTPVALHNALETHGAVARWEGSKLTVWSATQGVFGSRDDLAKFFKIPAADVRVVSEYLGGGFGAKFGAGIPGIVAALLARKAGAPVKLLLDRHEENLAAGNRPSSVQALKIGAKRDGTLTAIRLEAYGTPGIATGAGCSGPAWSIYACANVQVEDRDVHTNAGPSAPFRAPGFPQGSFGLESALDEVAGKLGIDPLDLRKKNYIDKPAKALLRQYDLAAAAIGWQRRASMGGPPAVLGAPPEKRMRRGLGLGTAQWGLYGGPPADAKVTIHSDGSVECACGTQDIGTGTRTAMAVVTAEVLGLRPADIKVVLGDTSLGLYSPASGGSVTLNSILPAVRAAAEGARAKLAAVAAPALGAEAGALDFDGGRVVTRDGARSLPFAKAAARLKSAVAAAQGARVPNYEGRGIELHGVQFAEAEVDTWTGRVRVVKVTAAHECGRVIDRLTAESQVIGGVIMGLSTALLEERVIDHDTGVVINANLEDYKLAGAFEIPEIVPILTEIYDPSNNVGVRGLGEPPIVPTAAAIANAVSHALGRRVRELPITPARVLDLLSRPPEA